MADFEVVRQAVIPAQLSTVHTLLADFHEWRKWSPWEDVDPDLHRTFTGPESGVGAKYAWAGNRKAGAGNMEIVSDTDREVGVRLEFEKPFKAVNDVRFTLHPVPDGTEVVWRMTGNRSGLIKVLSKVLPMDNMIGKDFEKGLDRLKTAAGARP
ncbi:SRPBCC family protein [Nocardia takedensis]